MKRHFSLALPPWLEVAESLTPERYAVRLDFAGCERIVTLKELSATEAREFSVPCEVTAKGRARLRAYWFGNVPVAILSASVSNGVE